MVYLFLIHIISMGFAIQFSSIAFGGFRLSSPEVVKQVGMLEIFCLKILNKDGLNDLIFFNLERSRIEILYRTKDGKVPDRINPVKQNRWDPVLEDAPYKKEYIFIPEAISVISTEILIRMDFLILFVEVLLMGYPFILEPINSMVGTHGVRII